MKGRLTANGANFLMSFRSAVRITPFLPGSLALFLTWRWIPSDKHSCQMTQAGKWSRRELYQNVGSFLFVCLFFSLPHSVYPHWKFWIFILIIFISADIHSDIAGWHYPRLKMTVTSCTILEVMIWSYFHGVMWNHYNKTVHTMHSNRLLTTLLNPVTEISLHFCWELMQHEDWIISCPFKDNSLGHWNGLSHNEIAAP